MSTLATAVQARVPTDRLIQLTRKNSVGSTTVDSTVLEYAVTDAAAQFLISAGVTFDDTNAEHIMLGVQGVMALLSMWNGQEAGEKDRFRFVQALERYRAVHANARITPVGTRTTGPSDDVDSTGQERRPEFDRTRFDRLDVVAPRDHPWYERG